MLSAALKPKGKAFFRENNAASRFLVWMREKGLIPLSQGNLNGTVPRMRRDKNQALETAQTLDLDETWDNGISYRENVVGKLWIPNYGEEDEFPLKPSEVDMLRRRFNVKQDFPEMVFFRLASIYLFNRRAKKVFGAMDELLLRNNILVRYSYHQLLLIEKA